MCPPTFPRRSTTSAPLRTSSGKCLQNSEKPVRSMSGRRRYPTSPPPRASTRLVLSRIMSLYLASSSECIARTRTSKRVPGLRVASSGFDDFLAVTGGGGGTYLLTALFLPLPPFLFLPPFLLLSSLVSARETAATLCARSPPAPNSIDSRSGRLGPSPAVKVRRTSAPPLPTSAADGPRFAPSPTLFTWVKTSPTATFTPGLRNAPPVYSSQTSPSTILVTT
mmetsp:Transcript_5370/g.24194  ORF Transcript_5370/g.24194 Transcript_5370/m.24194 type:complete len:223 (+) Transcript_5370:755-1423(+)